jgi:hypothetical protein
LARDAGCCAGGDAAGQVGEHEEPQAEDHGIVEGQGARVRVRPHPVHHVWLREQRERGSPGEGSAPPQVSVARSGRGPIVGVRLDGLPKVVLQIVQFGHRVFQWFDRLLDDRAGMAAVIKVE